MTTFVTDHDSERLLRELDERTRSAWSDYRGSLIELDGKSYEETELVSWDRLQQALHDLADERERVVGPSHAEHDASR